ncbi:MAG: AAA family ATPase [Bacteroides sp.]|nr:AAA family ATPase [Bacteroides sp.]
MTEEIFQLKERENLLNAKWVNERRQIDKLQEFQNNIEELKVNRDHVESIGRYDEVARFNREIEALITERDNLMQEISETESPLLKLSLDSEDIKETITRSTGIPVKSMSSNDWEILTNMKHVLIESVRGQDHAIASVCNVIKRSRMGLGSETSPIGSFLFMGTTGVGKTELAKAISEYMFGSREMLIRIDMSEFQQEHSVSRLFGAPPGYIGYDQGGQLTEAVRRKPYSVVLLDEIEKAHPKICETLLQVLDDGRMTDGKGRFVNFKNTIIIMTSNLGAELINSTQDCQSLSVRHSLIQMLKQQTSPEFVNRIDDIIVFNSLSKDILQSIAKKATMDSVRKLKNSGYVVSIDSGVPIFISANMDTSMGARPLKRIVNHQIIDALIDKILIGELVKQRPIHIGLDNNGLTFTNV